METNEPNTNSDAHRPSNQTSFNKSSYENTNQNSVQFLSEVEKCCNSLDGKSAQSEEIMKINAYLTAFMKFENYENLKVILYQSSSPKAKFFAANALISLITQNYLSISLTDKIQMYDSLVDYIVSISFC